LPAQQSLPIPENGSPQQAGLWRRRGGFIRAVARFGRVQRSLIKERVALRRAVAAELNAKTEAAKSQQVARFLQDMLNGVGPAVALGRDTRMLQEILDKTAERLGKDLGNQPEVEAELRSTIGNVYDQLGLYEKASAMHRAAVAIHRSLPGDQDHQL